MAVSPLQNLQSLTAEPLATYITALANVVQLAALKAAAHLDTPACFPLPAAADCLEHLLARQLTSFDPPRQAAARLSARRFLISDCSCGLRAFACHEGLDLTASVAIEDQAWCLVPDAQVQKALLQAWRNPSPAIRRRRRPCNWPAPTDSSNLSAATIQLALPPADTELWTGCFCRLYSHLRLLLADKFDQAGLSLDSSFGPANPPARRVAEILPALALTQVITWLSTAWAKPTVPRQPCLQ